MRKAAVAGVAMTRFGRYEERSLKDISSEAIRGALDDAGLEMSAIEAVFFGNATAGVTTGQECIRGETVTHHMGFGALPVTNVENACASGANAFHLGWSAVAGGQYDTVLVVGAEKLYFRDKTKSFSAFMGGMDLDYADYGEGAGVDRSPFVDRYAKVADLLMNERGVDQRAFATVAAKAHTNGSRNPKAQRQTPKTAEEVLAARHVLGPLTVLMCSPVGDGAAAAVVTSKAGAGGITVLASQLRSLPAAAHGPSDSHELSAAAAFEQAGMAPTDMHLAELHDATAPGEMISWVEAGFCAPGEEQKWAVTRHTELGGELPVNPSGGLIARGHPIGATGVAQVYEVVQQLRGTAGARQVELAKRAFAQCGGGLINGSTAVSCAHVFERQ